MSEIFAEMPSAVVPGLERGVLEMEIIPVVTCGLLGLVMLGCIMKWLARGSRLRRAQNMDALFTGMYQGGAHALSLFQDGHSVEGSPRCNIYLHAARELAFHLLGTDAVDKNFAMRLRAAGRIAPAQWEAVQRAARRSLSETTRWFREGLAGTGLKALLLIGLLGALFNVLEHAGTDTLDGKVMAASLWPVAVALLLFGVGAAWHRSVVRRVETAVAALEDYVVELGMVVDRAFVDHRQPMESLPSLGGMGLVDGPTFSVPPAEPSKSAPRMAVAE